MKRTILFADNDPATRDKWGQYLENEEYTVRLASTRQEAHKELESGKIDLAVIDVRLEKDDDPDDRSGLELAVERIFRHVPKVILTGYTPRSYKDQRLVWEPVGGEPPAVIAFVGKDEGPEVLLDRIRNALEVWPRLSLLSSKVSEQIKADHRTIRAQARWTLIISLIISLLGFGIIVTGIFLAWQASLAIGIVGAAAGLILNAVGYLFFARLDLANGRMDVYHQELLQTYWLEFLLSITERLPADRENACIERAVQTALESWYPQRGRLSGDGAKAGSGQDSSQASATKE
jgi:CheY-like chemotaxis protein